MNNNLPDGFVPDGQAAAAPEGFTPDSPAAGPGAGSQTGFIQGMIQSVAQDFTRPLANVKKMALMTEDAFGAHLSDDERQQLMSDQYDFGFLGKAKPLGSSGDSSTASGFANNVWDALGGGMKMASWLAPAAKEGEAALQAGKSAALEMAKTPFWSKAANFIKETAPFALTQSVGAGMQSKGEGKSATQAAGDAVFNYIGDLGGIGLMRGAGGIVKSIGGKLLQSSLLKGANQFAVDLANKAFGLDPAFNGSNAALRTTQAALEQQYQTAHKSVMDAVSQAMKTPSNWGEVFDGVVNKANSFIDSMMKAKDAKYAQVFSPSAVISSDFSRTNAALSEARKFLNDDANPSFKGFVAENSPLGKYLNMVNANLMDSSKGGGMSMKAVDDLYRAGVPVADGAQNKQIQAITHAIYQDAHEALSASEDPAMRSLADTWKQASNDSKTMNSVLSSKFVGALRGIGTAKEFSEKVFGMKPSVANQTLIDGLDQETKSKLSDIVYNNLIDKARSVSSDPAKQSAYVDKFLDTWGQTSLLSPQHQDLLGHYSEMLKGSYSDFVAGMRQHLGMSEEEGADIAAKASKASAASDALGRLNDLSGALKGKDLYRANPDGTYDLTQLKSAVDRLNVDGRLDDVAKTIGAIGDMQAVTPTKFKAVVKMLGGGALVTLHHPLLGLSAIVSGAKSFVGTKGAAMTTADAGRIMDKLIESGHMTPSLLTEILTGRFDGLGSVLQKASGAEGGRAAQEAAGTIGE